MGFAPVKSSEYGEPKRAARSYLWSEAIWRRLVKAALLEIEDREFRLEVAKWCSFTFQGLG